MTFITFKLLLIVHQIYLNIITIFSAARDHFGHSPLHKSVMANQEDVLRFLVEKFPATIEDRDNVSENKYCLSKNNYCLHYWNSLTSNDVLLAWPLQRWFTYIQSFICSIIIYCWISQSVLLRLSSELLLGCLLK